MNNHLQGVTILDLSSLLPAPFATHLLAKMGARVLKIESPTRPDPAREFGEACYRAINDVKELVWLNLKEAADRAKLYELVRTADAVVEGYRPEVRTRLGIEYERLLEMNPRLTYCSVGGYNPRGPYRDRAGHDINFVARSGILDLTRDHAGHCVLPGIPIGDYLVAYSAALRMACGLLSSKATGKGCHLEVTIEETLFEAQMPYLRGGSVDSLVAGKYPCYRIYEIPGGSFALGAIEAKFWEKFCQTIGRADLIPFQYATGEEGRQTVQNVLKSLSLQSFDAWQRLFSKVDCCIEPVLSIKDVVHGLQSS